MPYLIREDETYRFGELKPSSQTEQAYYADAWKGNKFVVLPGTRLKSYDRKIKTLSDLASANPTINGQSLFVPNRNYTFFKETTTEDGALKLDLLETWTAGSPVPQSSDGLNDGVQVFDNYGFNNNDPKDKARLARLNAEKRQLEERLQQIHQEDQLLKSRLLDELAEERKHSKELMDRMLEERTSAVRNEEEAKRHLADRMRLDQEVERERERADKARAEGLADALNENTLGNKFLEGLPDLMSACGPAVNALLMKVVNMIPDPNAPDPSANVNTAPQPDPAPSVGFPIVQQPSNGILNPS